MKITCSNTEFNEYLMKLLCDDDKEVINEKNNFCLISNLPLEEDHVKLTCNHLFNYSAIYKEIKNQKKKSYLETQKLSAKQLKCPYCRNIQTGLLMSKPNFPNVYGVNWPPKYQLLPNTCIYTYISGKKKNKCCRKRCAKEYCLLHQKIIQRRSKKFIKKQEIKQHEEQKIQEQQMITSTHNPLFCSYIFKKGKNKGKQCSTKKLYNNSTFCKRHFKNVNKKQTLTWLNNPLFSIHNLPTQQNSIVQ